MNRWSTKPLIEICERITDGSHRTPPFAETGYPFATVAHVDGDGRIDFSACKRISPADFKELKKNDCRPLPGDVLFSKDGTVGKVAVIDFDTDFVVLSSLAIIRPNPVLLHQKFLAYALRSDSILSQAINRKSGSAIRRIILRDLCQVSIPVPPLAEQERIVKLLDEADELRKLRAQADRRTSDLIPALFHEMFGDLATNPLNLPVRELGSLCKVVGGGTPSKKQAVYWTGKIPWVSPKDMSGDEIHDTEDHISEQALNESATNLIPANSILVVTRSGILRHTLPVVINTVPVTINQDIKAFIPSSECDATFLATQLRVLAPNILGLVRIGATVQNIETEALKRLLLFNPPFLSQREFAMRSANIRALETEQAASRSRLDNLFQSMLYRAFSGDI